jgi:hypothetical protein
MCFSNTKKITLTILMLVMAAMLVNPRANAGTEGVSCGSTCQNVGQGCGTRGTCSCLSTGCNCQCTACGLDAPQCCPSPCNS